MNKLILCILLGCAVLLTSLFVAKNHKRERPGDHEILSLSAEMLPVNKGDHILRKRAGGWQVCQVKRFVVQETLEVLRARNGEVEAIARSFDSADSNPLSTFAWVCIVLKAAPEPLISIEKVKIDETFMKAIEESDEILVKAIDVKPPDFVLIK